MISEISRKFKGLPVYVGGTYLVGYVIGGLFSGEGLA